MILNDDFDKKIFDYFNRDTHVPKTISDSILDVSLKGHKKNKNYKKIIDIVNLKKAAIYAISLIAISTGVVFASDITQFIQNIFQDNKGVETAINNDFFYTNSEKIYSNLKNTNLELVDLIMDDYTLDLNLRINFDDFIDTANIEKIKFTNMIISDEMNNILYSSDINTSKKYCEQKGIDNSLENIQAITINTSSSYFINHKYNNLLVMTLNLSADNEKFPLSKQLFISFEGIEFIKEEESYKVEGKWNTNILVPNNFLKRETIIYKPVYCNNGNVYIDSINAQVYETGMNFEMTMYWGDYETTCKKMERIRKENILASQLIIQEKCYVENENGQKFYPSQSTSSDGGYSFGINGRLIKWETFNLTKFDMTNTLKVVLTTIDDEQIIIKLKNK